MRGFIIIGEVNTYLSLIIIVVLFKIILIIITIT